MKLHKIVISGLRRDRLVLIRSKRRVHNVATMNVDSRSQCKLRQDLRARKGINVSLNYRLSHAFNHGLRRSIHSLNTPGNQAIFRRLSAFCVKKIRRDRQVIVVAIRHQDYVFLRLPCRSIRRGRELQEGVGKIRPTSGRQEATSQLAKDKGNARLSIRRYQRVFQRKE